MRVTILIQCHDDADITTAIDEAAELAKKASPDCYALEQVRGTTEFHVWPENARPCHCQGKGFIDDGTSEA